MQLMKVTQRIDVGHTGSYYDILEEFCVTILAS